MVIASLLEGQYQYLPHSPQMILAILAPIPEQRHCRGVPISIDGFSMFFLNSHETRCAVPCHSPTLTSRLQKYGQQRSILVTPWRCASCPYKTGRKRGKLRDSNKIYPLVMSK